ncbi:MAG TPA: MarR family winged helix-turn-helix transcriptional regulator [Ktedonobacteraceae bacterium]|jgi:DNA-binding MarR family transcriptional regulator|nr:MarR family winged helix-turn-helix transcriptional regulator [Ktedonobacteraceae bacterium]
MEKETPHIEANTLAEVARSCLCLGVRQTARVITQVYDDILQPSGLRTTQFNLLVAVALAQEMPLTRLAEILLMDRTTLARNLKPLERQGLLAIETGMDRRVHLVRMTSHGLQILQEALPYWRQAQEQVKARLGQEEWDTFSAHLQVAMARIPSS